MATYRLLLVHVDSGTECDSRLRVVAKTAREFGAHVLGVHVTPNIEFPTYVHARIPKSVFEAQKSEAKSATENAAAHFRNVLSEFNVSTTWCADKGFVDRQLEYRARTTDLVFASVSRESGATNSGIEVAEYMILCGSQPVVLLPSDAPCESVIGRTVVAWDGSRESARAVRDALPILERAPHVELVSVRSTRDDRHVSTTDIQEYLRCHSIGAESIELDSDNLSIGESLLQYASQCSADLMVMGGYGHTRLREMVFGGVTQHVLTHAHLPVFLSR